MNRTFGSSAGVIALLVFALHIFVPSGPEGRGGEQSAEGGTDKAKAPHSSGSDKDEAPREGPWLATRAFFQSAANPAKPFPGRKGIDFTQDVLDCYKDTKRSKSCAPPLSRFFGVTDGSNVQFILATVPDPMHTRLSLYTDSSLDAIQKAATEAGWLFATQWLPWNDAVDLDEKDPSKRSKDREFIRNRETQPGILVFRGRVGTPETLLVFVVGETPTGGINSAQFHLARAYMRAINEPHPIRIQGPTFSGSLYSLGKLIGEDKETAYLVRSGTLQGWDEAAGRLPGKADFHSASAYPGFQEIVRQLGIPGKDAAILVEDETEYGHSVADNAGVRTFRFPRDISHLRNAYREAVQASQGGAPTPDLDFSLKDADVGEDSIPTFSKTQSPLSQNAILNEITNAIRREQIRIVQISASNVLDRLFLARVLKRQCPDTRILITSPDLLFVEAAQSDALTGILAVSNYPLFAESNAWMGQQERPFTFPSSNAEGVYNAMLLLLTAELPNQERCDLDFKRRKLADYHWKGSNHPPTWLLTLDREGFVPMRILQTPDNVFEDIEPKGSVSTNLQLPKPSPAWTLLSTLTALISISWLVYTFFLWKYPEWNTNAAFAVDATNSALDRRRLFYVLLLGLFLTAIEGVIGAPLWLRPPEWPVIASRVFPAAALLSIALCIVFALRAIKGRSVITWAGTILLILITFPIIPGLWARSSYWRRDTGFFFLFRSAEFRFGTSPAWPVFAALCVLLLFSLVHLTRLYLAVYERPEILIEDFKSALQGQIKESCCRFNDSVESSLGVIWEKAQLIRTACIVVGAVVLCMVARVDLRLSSVDGHVYNFLSITLMLAATAALLLVTAHVMTLWHSLQGLLTCFRTLPLSRAFIRPDLSGSSRPIWVRRLNVQSIDIHARALIVLHDIAIALPAELQWVEWLRKYRGHLDTLTSVDKPLTRAGVLETRHSIRELSVTIAARAFEVAHDRWITEGLVEHFDPPSGSGAQEPPDRGYLEIDGNPKEPADLAETFVALHYSSFLMYAVRHIRNLMIFLSAGFVLLVISMNSYSHQSPEFIGRGLLVLFVLIGAAMLTCLTGMERDYILSRIAGTTPGKLNLDSYLQVLAYGAMPIIGLLASQFPSISSFLYSWVAPTLKAVH